MSNSILMITQTKIGRSLLKGAQITYKTLPMPVKSFCVGCQADPDLIIPKLAKLLETMDDSDGILILTDLYGSTASNIAHELKKHYHKPIKVISGLNLPMLIKALNYPKLDLDALAEKAIEGGKQGVVSAD